MLKYKCLLCYYSPLLKMRYGMDCVIKKKKAFLNVTFAKAEKGILVTITDNGIGREKSKEIKTEHQKKRDSKGLGNIKNRVALLNELHDCKIGMEASDAGLTPDVGTTVVVRMGGMRNEE